MSMRVAVITTILAILPMWPANAIAQAQPRVPLTQTPLTPQAQTPQTPQTQAPEARAPRTPAPKNSHTLKITEYPGEAQILLLNGKSYIDLESLARLTHGTLAFESNRTILTLHPADREVQATVPQAHAGFSRAFTQAGIEELSVIREWRGGIVDAVQNNTPVPEEWLSAQHRLADKNLALAGTAVSTDDDRSAYPLLSAEFNHMQNLSDLYLTMRRQAKFISPDAFSNGPLEDQILSCAQGFVSMMESHVFQDQPACH